VSVSVCVRERERDSVRMREHECECVFGSCPGNKVHSPAPAEYCTWEH